MFLIKHNIYFYCKKKTVIQDEPSEKEKLSKAEENKDSSFDEGKEKIQIARRSIIKDTQKKKQKEEQKSANVKSTNKKDLNSSSKKQTNNKNNNNKNTEKKETKSNKKPTTNKKKNNQNADEDSDSDSEDDDNDLQSRVLPGQRYPTPPKGDPVRAFYESMLKAKPNSEMALKHCIENGCLSKEEAETAIIKLEKLQKGKGKSK